MSTPHRINIRIYYEDTDSGGVVYYANYLKFAERARTELLRNLGINQSSLEQDSGILFVVKNANLELISPAKLDDVIEVKTNIRKLSGASINMLQEISIVGKNIATLDVTIVCINKQFKPTRIPKEIKEALSGSTN